MKNSHQDILMKALYLYSTYSYLPNRCPTADEENFNPSPLINFEYFDLLLKCK